MSNKIDNDCNDEYHISANDLQTEMKPLISIVSILFLAFVSACIPQQPGSPTTITPYSNRPTDSPEVMYQPRFETTECWGSVPVGVSATCGFVVLPENRSIPLTGENTVRLAVIVLRAPHVKYTQPPTLLLGGGPGGDVVGMYADLFRNYQTLQENGLPDELYPGHLQDVRQFIAVMDLFVKDLQKREFIYLDQRGTGYSQPSLKCHGENWTTCRSRLVASGIDIAAYNTLENAADVNDVRLALGYEQLNLQGGSYGTRLALEVMRQYPTIVRAAVLDGVVPPQTDWAVEMVRRYDDALQVLFDHCQADPQCDAAYPDLDSMFYSLVERLNAQPIKVPVKDQVQTHNGDDLRDTVWNALYDAEKIRFLPMMIAQVNDGNPATWGEILASYASEQNESIAWGMHYSVECAERWAFETPQDLVTASAGLPLAIREAVSNYFSQSFWVCEQWNIPRSPLMLHTPVHSDIPTLLLSGEFDPAAQPVFAELAAQTLTHHYNYVLPYRGHTDVFTNLCQNLVTSAFLDDPYHEADTTCITEMDVSTFVLP